MATNSPTNSTTPSSPEVPATVPANHRRWPFGLCDHHHRCPRSLLVAVILLGVIILVVGGQLLWAKMAADKLVARYSRLTSANINGRLSYIGQDFLAPLNSDLNFAGQLRRGSGGLELESDFNGQFLSRHYQGQVVATNNQLYFNLSGPELPVIRFNQSANLYPIQPGWHQNRLDNSLYDWYCEHRPGSSYPSALELYRLVRGLRWRTYWVNPLARLQGQTVTHLRGGLDAANLPELLNRLNSQLPAGCGLTQFYPEDLERLQISYDIWTGEQADRFKLSIVDPTLDSKLELVLNVSHFNQSVTITPPAQAIDLNRLR